MFVCLLQSLQTNKSSSEKLVRKFIVSGFHQAENCGNNGLPKFGTSLVSNLILLTNICQNKNTKDLLFIWKCIVITFTVRNPQK